MDIKLKIPTKIYNKYTYLLNRFKSLEWSGPAWYRVKTDKDGFPSEWKIVHFHPLNLGSSASTEWEAKDLAKILRETLTLMPSLKKAYMGLIHSHNTMGAFLSGTDTNTIQDMAPDEGFYGSLVVASSGKALHAFGFGYKDQYKVRHCLEAEEEDIQILAPGIMPHDNWVTEADIIEKNKPTPAFGQQVSLLSKHNYKKKEPINIDDLGTKRFFERRDKLLHKLSNSQKAKTEAILLKWDGAEMSDIECERQLTLIKLSYTQIETLMDWADDNATGNVLNGYGYNYGDGFGY
tara:strand:+ start:2515 stop:3390 length:876 start_codon:yes stop_codon:yes gene_type:complete